MGLVEQVLAKHKVKLILSPLITHSGEAHAASRTIWMRKYPTEVGWLRVLFHEIGHVVLKHRGWKSSNEFAAEEWAELEAIHYGIDFPLWHKVEMDKHAWSMPAF